MTWAQIAIIPKNRAREAKVTASSITVLNMLFPHHLEHNKNIHHLFRPVKIHPSPSILPILTGHGENNHANGAGNGACPHTLMEAEVFPMRRVFIVAGGWFLFWMSIGAAFGGLSSDPGGFHGAYSGAMNGAWIATLTSFAWPWIMPEAINRWMDG